MKTVNTQDRKPGLKVTEAYGYFLKGNLLFALNGIVVYAIDAVAVVFPPLFQQVYTDNIITHKNPEWFTPLMTLYVLLFLLELFIWLAFSIIRRKSQARINISSSSNYLWTVLRLPMTRFSQFSPGELVARYTTIPRTIRQIDFTLPSITALFFPAICCILVTLFNWKLGILAIFSIVDPCRQYYEHGENSDPFNDLKDAFELVFCFIWKNKALHRDQGCAGADNDPDMLFLFFH